MKKIFSLILFFISLNCFSQATYKDTTFSNGAGQNCYARVWLPPTYYQRTDSFQMIIFTPGLGEYGTDTSKLSVYGPFAYKNAQNWNGRVALNNTRGDSIELIIIAVMRLDPGYLQPPFLTTLYSNIANNYRAAKKSIHATGLSLGGWSVQIACSYQPTAGDYTFVKLFKTIVNVQGVVPSDTYGSTPAYPNRFKYFAKLGGQGTGGRYVGFEQYVADGRDINNVVTTMNDTLSGSAIYVGTNYGSGNHCCFERNYGGVGYLPLKYTLDGKQQTIYEFMARQGDTSLGLIPGGIRPSVNAGVDRVIYQPTGMAVLYGTSSDADGTVTSKQWTKILGPSGDTIYQQTSDTAFALRMLTAGTYSYEFAVTDNSGLTSRDTVNIIVQPYHMKACNVSAPVTYVVSPTATNEIYITNASGRGWKGGDTLLIPAGYYTSIEIDSFGGDPCRDIIIRNVGGQVKADVMRFGRDVRHVSIIGKDSAGVQYGFQAKSLGFARVSRFTLKKMKFGPNTTSVGVYGKETFNSTNYATYYGSYTTVKIMIDSCRVDSVDGEGFYIGDTAPNLDPYVGGIPQRNDSTTISNCTVSNTGWDGIQLSNSRNGNKIFNNTVYNFGLQDRDAQRAGIISGGNTNCVVYNNKIYDGYGNGLQFFGYGTLEAYNNTITNVGNTTKNIRGGISVGEESIFCAAYLNGVETNPKQYIWLHDNYIKYPKSWGAIRMNDDNSNALPALLENNKFCFISDPGGSWKTNNISIAQTYTDINNILYCILDPRAFIIRYKFKF